MAESRGVSGILGTDAESAAEALVAETPTPLDPTAAALAAEAAKSDPELAQKASAYFDRQSHLVEIQTEHLHEQRSVNLQLLKLRRFDERLRVGLRLLVIFAAAIIAVALLRIVWSAVDDHGLVVEAFSVPPDLLQQGITGRVVAAELIDQIDLLQSQTHTSRPPGSFRNNWGDDIKVEIPETGVSIGELTHILHQWLGSATRIDGEVTHTAAGLSIVARIHDELALRAAGAPTELDSLIRQIAEQAYASTQPYRYGVYLSEQHRHSEALAVFRDLVEHGAPDERPWGLVGVGNESSELTGFEDGFAAFRESLRLDPNQAISCSNIALTARGVGLDEEALATGQRCLAIPPKMMALHFTAAAAAWDQLFLEYNLASDLGDHQSAARYAQSMVVDTTFNFGAEKSYGALAIEERALDHDASAVEGGVSDADATSGMQANSDYFVAMPNILMAFESGDFARAVNLGEALARELASTGVARVNQQQVQRRVYPVVAEALARLGRFTEAEAMLKEIPANAYDGWRARGRIASLRREFDAGEKAFAEAVRQAPSIPRAYSDWGDLLAAKGDTAGALTRYAEANSRGPRFADPLKAWGDVLMKQGNMKDALAKYDKALKYAPNWKQLKEAREAVAKQKS